MNIRDHDAMVESYSAAGAPGPAEAAEVPLGWFVVAVGGTATAGLPAVQAALQTQVKGVEMGRDVTPS
jgi:hypothetical protein